MLAGMAGKGKGALKAWTDQKGPRECRQGRWLGRALSFDLDRGEVLAYTRVRLGRAVKRERFHRASDSG